MQYNELRNLCRGIAAEIDMLACLEKDETEVKWRLMKSIAVKVERIVEGRNEK